MDFESCSKSVEGGSSGKGKTSLLKYLKGGRLTQRQAIQAKCYDCMGFYVDGRYNCEISDCPLYPWMPYKGKEKKTTLEGDRDLSRAWPNLV